MVNFLTAFGAVLLTFLAGAEIDPDSLRVHLKAALAIGFVSFLAPFSPWPEKGRLCLSGCFSYQRCGKALGRLPSSAAPRACSCNAKSGSAAPSAAPQTSGRPKQGVAETIG